MNKTISSNNVNNLAEQHFYSLLDYMKEEYYVEAEESAHMIANVDERLTQQDIFVFCIYFIDRAKEEDRRTVEQLCEQFIMSYR